MLGKTFNRLTVIAAAGRDKWKNALWLCACSCGNQTTVIGRNLRCGSTQSCGCYNADRTRETHSKEDSYFKRIFRNIKSQAKVRGLTFALTEDAVYTLITSRCHYCAREPYEIRFWARHNRGVFKCGGIDRKDSGVGYEATNCVPCCSRCNIAKMDYTEAEFLETIKLIYEARGLEAGIRL